MWDWKRNAGGKEGEGGGDRKQLIVGSLRSTGPSPPLRRGSRTRRAGGERAPESRVAWPRSSAPPAQGRWRRGTACGWGRVAWPRSSAPPAQGRWRRTRTAQVPKAVCPTGLVPVDSMIPAREMRATMTPPPGLSRVGAGRMRPGERSGGANDLMPVSGLLGQCGDFRFPD